MPRRCPGNAGAPEFLLPISVNVFAVAQGPQGVLQVNQDRFDALTTLVHTFYGRDDFDVAEEWMPDASPDERR